MNNLQYLPRFCILLAVTMSCRALSDNVSYSGPISNMVPSVIGHWDKFHGSYEEMLAQNIKDTFGKGSMNTFTRLANEDVYKVAGGFYTMDPVVHVLFSDLQIQHLPIMEKIKVDMQIPGNVLVFTSNLTNIHIKAQYSLHRTNPESVIDSDQPVDGVSPFLLQKVQEFGDVTIVADRCRFEGILLLVPSEQTYAVANSNYKITNCNFNLEILSKVTKSAPLFVPYFGADEAKALQSLMAQTLGTLLDLTAKTAIVSTLDTRKMFDEQYQRRFGYAYSFFSTYIGNLWSELLDRINDKGKGNTINLDSRELDTQFKFLWGDMAQSMDVQISKLQLHGLNTAYSGRTGTVVKCADCSKILLVETLRFSRLQITGEVTRSGVSSKVSTELKDAKVLVSLVEKVKEKTKSLHSTQVTGFRNVEFLFTDTKLEQGTRDMLSSSITAYIIRIIPDYLKNYITDNVPAALEKRNTIAGPVSDDDDLRTILISIFGDIE